MKENEEGAASRLEASAHDPQRAVPCSVCGRPVVAAFRPFCSPRCANVDLGRWLSGSYAIAGEDGDADDVDGLSGQRPGTFL